MWKLLFLFDIEETGMWGPKKCTPDQEVATGEEQDLCWSFLLSNQYSQPLGLSLEHFAKESMGFSYFVCRFGRQEMGVKEGQRQNVALVTAVLPSY